MLQVVAMALGLVGCVMPPDAEYVLPPVDLAPRIEDAKPVPYNIVDHSPDCNHIYSANITDPDPGDTLYWQYFIDYQNHPSQASKGTTVPRDALTQTVPVNFTVFGNDLRFDKDATNPHTVELIVADRPFAPEPHQDPTSTASTPGKVTWITWTVRWSTQTPPATICD